MGGLPWICILLVALAVTAARRWPTGGMDVLGLHPIQLDMDEEDGRRFPIRTLRAVVRQRRDGPVIYLRFGGWGSLCLGRNSLARARQLMEQLSEAILVAQEIQKSMYERRGTSGTS